MSRRGRAFAVAAAGVAVSAAALALVFGRLSWSHGPQLQARIHFVELRAALASARAGWLAGFAALCVASLAPRALQTRALARRKDGRAPALAASWHAVAVGMLAQNLLPARLGEVARVATLARAGQVAPSVAAGAAVLGRVLDLGGLLVTTCVPLLLLGAAANSPAAGVDLLRHVAWVGALAGVALIAAVALLYRKRDSAARFAARIGPRTARATVGFADGLSALGHAGRLAAAALASLGAPLAMALSYYCALRAFDLRLGPAAAPALTLAVFVAVAVPAAPSALGVYHAAAFWLLGALGAPEPRAAAFAVATHAVATLALTLTGGWSAARVGYNLAP